MGANSTESLRPFARCLSTRIPLPVNGRSVPMVHLNPSKVLAGTSKFATNEYFRSFRLRCCAGSPTTVDPNVQPKTYQLPEIVLTSRQMRDIFIVLEVLLPLSTMLCGVLVWWRRR